jgi:hypothetical protein
MLMSAELFLNCILLSINDNREETTNLIQSLVNLFDTEVNPNTIMDQEITKFYVRILKTILLDKTSKDTPDELRVVLLRFKADKILETRQDVYNLLYETFMSKEKLSKSKTESIIQQIKNAIVWHRANRHTRTIFSSLAQCADMISAKDQAKKLFEIEDHAKQLNDVFTTTVDMNTSKSMVDHINMSDKVSIKKGMEKNRQRSITGVIKVGLQGLTKMTGIHKGFLRGESMCYNALSHHYKSGFLVSAAIWTVMYNTPIPINGRPAIIIFSLENEAYQNMMWAFKHQYAQIENKSPDDLSDDAMIDWISDTFSKNGYTLFIERHLPYEFGSTDLENRIKAYQRDGWEIHGVILDYMNKMKKSVSLRHDLAVGELYSNGCNFTKSEGIFFGTAHQLSKQAAILANSGKVNVVKLFGPEHLSDSMDVQREVDLTIFGHKEINHMHIPYLTLQRGKHRYVDTTSETDKYFAMPFDATRGIIDDIKSKIPGFVRDIYTDTDAQYVKKADTDIFY